MRASKFTATLKIMQVLWFGDRYVGVNLENPSFAEVARAMGAEGITVGDVSQVGDALRAATDAQVCECAIDELIQCIRNFSRNRIYNCNLPHRK